VAQALASAAVREHESRGTQHAAWQRIPLVEIESAVSEYVGRDAVGDEAHVVLGKRKDPIREGLPRFVEQLRYVEFILRDVLSLSTNSRWVRK
jgi:hypothetical protein